MFDAKLREETASLRTVRCSFVVVVVCLLFSLPVVCLAHDERHDASAILPEVSFGQEFHFDQPNETTYARYTAAQNHDLGHAILDLARFTQDELHMRSLMSNLDPNGGVRLLRDLALRTRSFKSAFKAWEEIHLVEEDGMFHEQRVVHRLRSSQVANLSKVIQVYDEFRSFITSLATKLFPWTSPYFGDLMSLHASFEGRGLVFTTGDVHASYLLTSIPALRELGCDLPVEVMYLGEDDLNDKNRELLNALPNVITRDISLMIDDKGWEVKGWAAKPFAILYSSFREVVFIDADALFFQNSKELFSDEDYQRTGALFFRDRKLSPESKRSLLKSILPNPISQEVRNIGWWTGESGHIQDSGVVVLDKWRHFVPLLLTARLNGPDRDGDPRSGKKGVYDLMYGDKETFWLSWEMAAEKYAFHSGAVGTMGALEEHSTQLAKLVDDDAAESKSEDEDVEEDSALLGDTICSSQLLHFGTDGLPLWWNGWLGKDKVDDRSYAPFAMYMREPQAEGSPWTLRESNVVCLTSTEHDRLPEREQKIADDLLAAARQNSA